MMYTDGSDIKGQPRLGAAVVHVPSSTTLYIAESGTKETHAIIRAELEAIHTAQDIGLYTLCGPNVLHMPSCKGFLSFFSPQHGFLTFTRADIKTSWAKSGFYCFNIGADVGLGFFTTLSET